MANSFDKLTDTELEECTKMLDEQGVKGYESFLRKKVEEWKHIPLNIGVIGNSGAGKSSFINAVRELEADDDGAAKVGVIETTLEIQEYSHPNNKMMKFWDLPGVGTPNFPQETYLEKIGFDKFDFFLLLTHTRFTENDEWLQKEIVRQGKQFFFVRTKLQNDIDNDRRAHAKNYKTNPGLTEQKLIREIRRNIQDNLGDVYDEKKVFIIDSYEIMKFDFPELRERLIEDFPTLKRGALLLSMNTSTVKIVKMKIDELRSRIWNYAGLSCFGGAIPIPGLSVTADIGLIVHASRFFYQQLGFDEESLARTAHASNRNVDDLRRIVDAELNAKQFLTKEGITKLMLEIPATALASVAEEGLRFIPLIGSIAGAALSGGTIYYVLNRILNEMEKVALLVVQATGEGVVSYAVHDAGGQTGVVEESN